MLKLMSFRRIYRYLTIQFNLVTFKYRYITEYNRSVTCRAHWDPYMMLAQNPCDPNMILGTAYNCTINDPRRPSHTLQQLL